MPRYYFDVIDDDRRARDDIGVDCVSVHAAYVQATIALTEMARDYLPGDGPFRTLVLAVREGDAPKFSVKLAFETTPAAIQSES